MRKPIIGIFTFTITLLIGVSASWISHSTDSHQTQECFFPTIDSAPEQKLTLDKTDPTLAVSDSISINPCRDEDLIKQTISYRNKAVSMGIVNKRVLCGVLPEYPLELRSENTSDIVMVYVHANEKGEVAEANAKTGNNMLRPLAEKAAYQTKFPPFKYNGKDYRMFGLLIYHFDYKDGVSLINPESPKSLSLLKVR